MKTRLPPHLEALRLTEVTKARLAMEGCLTVPKNDAPAVRKKPLTPAERVKRWRIRNQAQGLTANGTDRHNEQSEMNKISYEKRKARFMALGLTMRGTPRKG